MGTLALVPVPIAAIAPDAILPARTLALVRRSTLVFAESAKSARAFLKAAAVTQSLQSIQIIEFNSDTPAPRLREMLAPVAALHDAIVVSESGAPGIADPGARLVQTAHALGIPVQACVGPSSILLALMASGLDGQRFAFHGYLPVDHTQLAEQLKALERRAQRDRATQLFIETPYRNERMLSALIEHCSPQTRLAIAANLTGDDEWVRVDSVAAWRRKPVTIGKRPAVFLIARD